MKSSQSSILKRFIFLIILRRVVPWSAIRLPGTKTFTGSYTNNYHEAKSTTTTTTTGSSRILMRQSSSPTATYAAARSSSSTLDDSRLTTSSREGTTTGRGAAPATSTLPFTTPYQILLPRSFPTTSKGAANGHDLKLSFPSALNKIRQALQRIVDNDHRYNSNNNNNDFMASYPGKILRIEQAISHPVDPLAWIDAQQQHLHKKSAAPADTALFYMATQEGTEEVSAIGSSLTLDRTDDIFTKWWKYLPQKSRFYGGSRFDAAAAVEITTTTNCNVTSSSGTSNTASSSDWEDFGRAFWMLPTIELSTRNETDGESVDSVLAVHLLLPDDEETWGPAAKRVLNLIDTVSHHQSNRVPPTTLPPVLSRDSNYGDQDGQELYEEAVSRSLEGIRQGELEKVVFARRQKLSLGVDGNDWGALNLLRRWKYSSNHGEGGHLFYLRPTSSSPEFFGCTPERLFRVGNNIIWSEALAGTRPRGSTQQDDEELLQDLFMSSKDRQENLLTGKYIESVFEDLHDRDWIEWSNRNKIGKDGSEGESSSSSLSSSSGFFVRRLLHLQHICQRYKATVRLHGDDKNAATVADERTLNITRYLLDGLHPTPAVCGVPCDQARAFIRKYETIPGFDRGFYSGPFGYVGRDTSDILVAIRSGLVVNTRSESLMRLSSASSGTLSRSKANRASTEVLVYAGAGIVDGSTLKDEWAETNYKLGVISSLFPQAPIALEGATTPNVAWATALVEELIRNGVTQFYVCPGSRSTPLVAAIAKAVRSNVGVVNAVSVHDERSAGFRAVGYGRGSSNRIAAVITSSGTAVANLYPAIVEAGVDAIPMLVITADRPYENRHTGANQAIDQVKMFSSTYVRWFRDVLPPDWNGETPVSAILSDTAHAVSVSRTAKGPVHLNLQFRENLAPEPGPIRNDGRVDAVTRFNGFRFVDVPGYARWSTTGDKWMKLYQAAGDTVSERSRSVLDVAKLVAASKRGIIVVGNLRSFAEGGDAGNHLELIDRISEFAKTIGFPIIAGVQSASLRFRSSAVVPFAEHLLKCPEVENNIAPDLIIQLGSPLVSTAIPKLIEQSTKRSDVACKHVLIHPHYDSERADPSYSVTHTISSDIPPFLNALSSVLSERQCTSELAPLVLLGRKLQGEMKNIIDDAAATHVCEVKGQRPLTEPELVVALSENLSRNSHQQHSLFLSNSMPVRDCEFFLYHFNDYKTSSSIRGILGQVGTNRGASGIDGIIASATGYAESSKTPTTLLIGDLAALHDIGSLHSLAKELLESGPAASAAEDQYPLTITIVNNGGGGIFSFLPIAQHGSTVSFEEFFQTPTGSYSFDLGTKAFGLPIKAAHDKSSFEKAYATTLHSNQHSVIEARVVGHKTNVAVHQHITRSSTAFLRDLLSKKATVGIHRQRLPIKIYGSDNNAEEIRNNKSSSTVDDSEKTLVLLHGWMGDKSEWDQVASRLVRQLPSNWRILSIDLPGHGNAPFRFSSDIQAIRSCLNLDGNGETGSLGIDDIAIAVLRSLRHHHGIKQIDAIAGYSLGGRVSLAMKRLCETSEQVPLLMQSSTKIVLLGANPGTLLSQDTGVEPSMDLSPEDFQRLTNDDYLASEIIGLLNKSILNSLQSTPSEALSLWGNFLSRWYNHKSIWGGLLEQNEFFPDMISKRTEALILRGQDISAVLSECSPPRNKRHDWRLCSPSNTLFMAGGLDTKYYGIGRSWSKQEGIRYKVIPDVGHALLLEAPASVSETIGEFLTTTPPIDIGAAERALTNSEDSMSERIISPPSLSSTYDDFLDDSLRRESKTPAASLRSIGSLEFEDFSIDLLDKERRSSPVFGIGWGDNAAANESSKASQRKGLVIQIIADNGIEVGIGEVSPLPGLHGESLQKAREQLVLLQHSLEDDGPAPSFDASLLLNLNGQLHKYLKKLALYSGVDAWLPSVHSGLEMALLSLASQVVSFPIHQALSKNLPNKATPPSTSSRMLGINGLITRSAKDQGQPTSYTKELPTFPSTKVKVGHQSLTNDAIVMSKAFQRSGMYDGIPGGNIRADANCAWNESQAIEFASALDGIDLHSVDRLEFIEEPLEKQTTESTSQSLYVQIDALERWYRHTGISYALDETLADLVLENRFDFDPVKESLLIAFAEGHRGCAAMILKPALLGIELSLRIARFARSELGIGAVFSSSFDSGIGLAHTAFLGYLSDKIESTARVYPHGVGTFTLLSADTLSPPFSSYVNENGMLNTASLSRALFGLSLEDMRAFITIEPNSRASREATVHGETRDDTYEASTATTSSGNEIRVVVSLPLPFSAAVACSRFTDLPQHSRWSPWISRVAYQGKDETEWTLNVRGIPIRWRATSKLLEDPLGIQWESVSGLSNQGRVEFLPESDSGSSCHMKVNMAIRPPRLLRPLFKGSSVFLEDFLRNKLLRWSLEMFRDVVKADLALERGDVELGDALYGAVEGKATAIEATLGSSPSPSRSTTAGDDQQLQ